MDENLKREFEKPLDAIKEDYFLRPDAFVGQPWNGDFILYRTIGLCTPSPEHALTVQKALKMFGYPTTTVLKDGTLYIIPDAPQRRSPSRWQER